MRINILITHLHTHSFYSLLEGVPSPKDLAQRASELGMTSLALTDHSKLTGAIEFFLACKAKNIKPVIGLELDIDFSTNQNALQTGPMVFLARNASGWANLCWLSSKAHDQSRPGSPLICPFEALYDHTDGIICLSGGSFSYINGLVRGHQSLDAEVLLRKLGDLYRDHFYIELQFCRPDDNQFVYELARLAKRFALPVVASHNIYYLDDDQADIQKVLAAIRLNVPVNKLTADHIIPEGSGFIDQNELISRFSHLPAAIENIRAVVADCNLELPLGSHNFPNLSLPEGIRPADLLRKKAFLGAQKLYGAVNATIAERLDHELGIIANSGYGPIFLVVEELLAFARNSDILFSSRGSAASSLVAHCLGITSPDPLKLDLYFERFLNPARTTPPDIDTDICSRDRDVVIQHVFDVYGADRVAMVGTINTYRPRSALADVAKAYDLPKPEIRKLVNQLPYFSRPGLEEDDDEGEAPFRDLLLSPLPRLQRGIISRAAAILGLPRHLSMHAGGIVISPGLMTELVPIQPSGQKGVTITQFDLVSLEHLGLVKIDLLGIRGLTVLGDVIDSARSKKPGGKELRLEFLEAIPLTDEITSDRIEKGQTIGCFQIESPGMRNTLKEINARSVDDVMAALALYRPGPLKGGDKDAFVRRHNGLEPGAFLHPNLSSILNTTHGVILYQEQVLRIAHDLAGLTIAESDILRRAMSHFDPGKQLEIIRENFIRGAWEKSKVNPEISSQIWDLMAAFAGYGFPKAHAASYAMISWRSAWCKSHFPAEFMAAVLANWGGYYSQQVYLTEAKRMGLEIHPPHINFSRVEFSVDRSMQRPILYMGLDQIRDLTRKAQRRIIAERPFQSLNDFLIRVDPRLSEAENLIKVGAFSGIGTIPDLLYALKENRWSAGQLPLFENVSSEHEDWSTAEKVAAQKEILRIGVDAHPIEIVLGRISIRALQTTAEIESKVGEKVRLIGTRLNWHRSFAGKQGTMAYITLEDLEGMVDVVVPPSVYNRCKDLLRRMEPIQVEGVVEMSNSRIEPVIRAENIILPD